jgi:hypothetical protein
VKILQFSRPWIWWFSVILLTDWCLRFLYFQTLTKYVINWYTIMKSMVWSGTKTPHASLLTSNSSLLHGLQVGIYFISMIYIKILWHQTSLRQKVCHKIFLVSRSFSSYPCKFTGYRNTVSRGVMGSFSSYPFKFSILKA